MEKDIPHLIEKFMTTASIAAVLWKGIDALFAYLHKRQKGFITDLIKEELNNELRPIKEDIQEIKKYREEDSRYQVKQFQKIMDILNK